MGSYLNLKIIDIVRETKDTVSLILNTANESRISFKPGQFLTFLIDDNGKEVRRGYSISSPPEELPNIRITIKRINKESPSGHCIDEAKVSQIMKSLPPLGNFIVNTSPENEREYFMFGAGSGITPLFSMLKSILINESKSKVVLFYGNRDESSIIFKKELEELRKRYNGRFELYHILSRPNSEWNGYKGRIDKEKVLQLLYKVGIRNKQEANYYLCGPDGMMQNVIHALDELKISHKTIHRENFVVKLLNDDDEIELVEREVTIFIHGNKHIVNVKPNESILQKALQLGLEIPNSCQQGECGTCKARLLSGKLKLISQTALSEDEIKNGYCLTCVGYPASENVVILYENPIED